jgi:hypothetical protein
LVVPEWEGRSGGGGVEEDYINGASVIDHDAVVQGELTWYASLSVKGKMKKNAIATTSKVCGREVGR